MTRPNRDSTEPMAANVVVKPAGPTEGMNLCIKKVKRAGHGYRCFGHYRLRVLLHTGGCNWDRYTTPARPIRTRCSPVK